MAALTDLTIAQLAAALAKKETSAVEVADAHLEKLDEHRALNAFITETPDKARDMAKASDARRAKGEAGLLEGVPLAIKDLFCTEGVQTTAGSHILEGFVPPYESTVTDQPVEGGRGDGRQDQPRRVRHGLVEHDQPFRRRRESVEAQGRQPQAGARRLVRRLGRGGRGLHGAGQHRHRHRRLDPPAGVVLRHRRPEADLRPLLALGRRGLRQLARPAGPVRPHRRGQRAAAAGAWPATIPRTSTSAPLPVPDFAAAARNPDIKGLRVGIPKEYRVDGTSPEIVALWDKGMEMLKAAGAVPVEVSLPHTKYALPAYYIVAPAECSSNLARYDGVRFGLRVPGKDLTEMYQNTRGAGFGKEVRRRIMIGTYVLSAGYYDAYYKKAQQIRSLIARDFKQAFEKCDVLLTPTAPTAAFAAGEKMDDPVTMYLNDMFTIPASMAGLPGISVPAGLDKDGLPLGLQIIGRAFDEETMLRAAAALEKAAAFSGRRRATERHPAEQTGTRRPSSLARSDVQASTSRRVPIALGRRRIEKLSSFDRFGCCGMSSNSMPLTSSPA